MVAPDQQVNDVDSPSANVERLDKNMDVDERKPAANPTTVNNTATNSSNNSNEGNESNGLLGNNGHVGPTAADNFHVNGDLPVDIGVSDANMNNYSAAAMDDNATLTTASSAHISDVAFASKPASKPKTAGSYSAMQQLNKKSTKSKSPSLVMIISVKIRKLLQYGTILEVMGTRLPRLKLKQTRQTRTR